MNEALEVEKVKRETERLVVSVEEAGRILGISRATAFQRVHDGSIPNIRIGRRILVPKARLLAMLEG